MKVVYLLLQLCSIPFPPGSHFCCSTLLTSSQISHVQPPITVHFLKSTTPYHKGSPTVAKSSSSFFLTRSGINHSVLHIQKTWRNGPARLSELHPLFPKSKSSSQTHHIPPATSLFSYTKRWGMSSQRGIEPLSQTRHTSVHNLRSAGRLLGRMTESCWSICNRVWKHL